MSLEHRTKQFAISVIHLFQAISNNPTGNVIGKQLLRSGTSVGAQYREARRARSRAEFASKIDSAIQELDESIYWLELLLAVDPAQTHSLQILHKEANEITAMLVASSKTAKQNNVR